MDSGFPQPDVDPGPNMVVGAALLAPAFSEDYSTWRMLIASDGTVIQELNPAYKSELFDTVCIHLRSFVDACWLSKIQSVAQNIGFATFSSEYRCNCSDQQHTSITLNVDGQPKRVTVYGPHMLADQGNTDIIGYLRLWNLLLDVSPYRTTVVTSRPEEEVRRRLRSIFGRLT